MIFKFRKTTYTLRISHIFHASGKQDFILILCTGGILSPRVSLQDLISPTILPT